MYTATCSMHSVCVSFTEAKLTAVQDNSHASSIHPNISTSQQFFFCPTLSLSLQVSLLGCSALARVHLRDHKIPTLVNSKHIFPLLPRHKVFALEHCSPTEQLATIPNRYKHTFNHQLCIHCIHGQWLMIVFTAQAEWLFTASGAPTCLHIVSGLWGQQRYHTKSAESPLNMCPPLLSTYTHTNTRHTPGNSRKGARFIRSKLAVGVFCPSIHPPPQATLVYAYHPLNRDVLEMASGTTPKAGSPGPGHNKHQQHKDITKPNLPIPGNLLRHKQLVLWIVANNYDSLTSFLLVMWSGRGSTVPRLSSSSSVDDWSACISSASPLLMPSSEESAAISSNRPLSFSWRYS